MATTTWKGQLTFGLVSIPVRLQRAARKERIVFNYLSEITSPDISSAAVETDDSEVEASEPTPNPDIDTGDRPLAPSRVKQSMATADEDEPVSRDEIVRGYEVAPRQFVTFRNHELKSLRVATSATMEIVRTVLLQEIDPVFLRRHIT
jgi:DNA end-binding protein Ku